MNEYVYIVKDGSVTLGFFTDTECASIFVQAYFEKYPKDSPTLSVSRRFALDMINQAGTPYIEFNDGPKFSMEGRNNGSNSN